MAKMHEAFCCHA